MSEEVLTRPPVLLNSLPKSGTHLLKKIVGLFPGMRLADVHIGAHPFREWPRDGGLETRPDGAISIPVGLGWPRLVPTEVIERVLDRLTGGLFGTAHVPYSKELAGLLARRGIAMVTIIRDPRDVIVSHTYHVHGMTGNDPLHQYYQTLSANERIMASMTGVKHGLSNNDAALMSIRERVEGAWAWRVERLNFTTSFERLVGSRGGGSVETQLSELRNLANHLGLPMPEDEILRIADNAYGESLTFRKGVIGGWREHFTEEHKRVCKELVGQLLVDLGYEKDLNW